MKIWLLPVHVMTQKTLEKTVDEALEMGVEDGKKLEFKLNKKMVFDLLHENAQMRLILGRK